MRTIAFKMLTESTGRFVAIVMGVTFAGLPIAQQLSIFCGLIRMTSDQACNITDAAIWVMDSSMQFYRRRQTDVHLDGATNARSVNGKLIAIAPLLESIAEVPILRDVKIIAAAWAPGARVLKLRYFGFRGNAQFVCLARSEGPGPRITLCFQGPTARPFAGYRQPRYHKMSDL